MEERNEEKKMYILCNRRLAPVYQSVQGGHALAQFCIEHPMLAKKSWGNQTLIYLTCRLDKKVEEMKEHGYEFTEWKEPDFNNTVTAVACYGDPDLLFTRLKTIQ